MSLIDNFQAGTWDYLRFHTPLAGNVQVGTAAANFEVDKLTTVSGEWENMSFDFSGQPEVFDFLVFMFDFGNLGDSSETSTFYFDGIFRFTI